WVRHSAGINHDHCRIRGRPIHILAYVLEANFVADVRGNYRRILLIGHDTNMNRRLILAFVSQQSCAYLWITPHLIVQVRAEFSRKKKKLCDSSSQRELTVTSHRMQGA